MLYKFERNIKITGASATEAWADIDHLDKETNVSIPSYMAVEAAKQWVEDNEK